MKLTFRMLDGAVSACARFEADAPDEHVPGAVEDQTRASEARVPLIKAAHIVRHGGEVLVLTKAELRELRKAFGNSTSDPDWYDSSAGNRNALLSVAAKLNVDVARWGPGQRKRGGYG